MTKPKLAGERGGIRTYKWPPVGEPEFEVPSVTAQISGGLAKPFLVPWAAKMVAEFAVENHDVIGKLLARDRMLDAVRMLKGAANSRRDGKAELGTNVHAALEAYVAGDPVPNMTEAERGYFDGGVAYLFEQDVHVIHSEVTLYSRTYGYAGTTDLFQTRGNDPTVEVADWKTSKSVYPDVALQLVAYAFADFRGEPDGREMPMPDPPVRRGVIVQLQPNRGYKAVPVDLTEELFSVFLAVQQMSLWSRVMSREVLEPPLRRAA